MSRRFPSVAGWVAALLLIIGASTGAAASDWAPVEPEPRSQPEESAQISSGPASTIGQDLTVPPRAATRTATRTDAARFNVGPVYALAGPTVVSESAAATVAAVTDRTLTRLYGASRYETAIEITRTAFPNGARTLLVAYGENFPDGLAASAAVVSLGAPLLLTPAASMPDAVLDEVRRLDPGRVIFVGGTGVVSEAVVAQVRAALPSATMERAGGLDRYETAVTISRLLTAPTRSAFVAVGTNFPDALSAGPVAGMLDAPLLLAEAQTLPASTEAELARRRPATVYVIGGLLSQSVRDRIAAASGGSVIVVAGEDRYATAQQVAQRFFEPTTPSITYTSGLNFPDALAAAALTIQTPGPILLDAGAAGPASASIDAGRFVSWYYPDTGRIIRYIPIVHPDDEFSAWATVGTPDPRRYDVFIVLTTGEDSSYCDGQPVSNPWMSQQYLPQPQPTGVALSDRCKKHRLDSWNTFMSDVPDGASLASNYLAREGVPITFDGRLLPTPRHYDATDTLVPATAFTSWIGPTSARISFDLGALDLDEIIWAIENTRLLRDEFPTQTEGDIVGAGYHNDSGVGSQYILADHQALYETLSTIDFGLPGSQYSAIGHHQAGRAFGARVVDYCGYMCHPAGLAGFVGPMGRFQYAYGWLRGGRWSAGEYDVTAGFSAYQSFGKWF
nr:cell wall-binding repeat-containing protein [Propionibacterium sp.]